ncbi:hypothetical protein GW915_12365 [bacterium]|nr:hypothetical protein [bacterium]
MKPIFILLFLVGSSLFAGPGSTGFGMAESMKVQEHSVFCEVIEMLKTSGGLKYSLEFRHLNTKDAESELRMHSPAFSFKTPIKDYDYSHDLINEKRQNSGHSWGYIPLEHSQFLRLAGCSE